MTRRELVRGVAIASTAASICQGKLFADVCAAQVQGSATVPAPFHPVPKGIKEALGLISSGDLKLTERFNEPYVALRAGRDLQITNEVLTRILQQELRTWETNNPIVFPHTFPKFGDDYLRIKKRALDVMQENDITKPGPIINAAGEALGIGGSTETAVSMFSLMRKAGTTGKALGKAVKYLPLVAFGLAVVANLYMDQTRYKFAELIHNSITPESFTFHALEIDVSKSASTPVEDENGKKTTGVWMRECLGYQSKPLGSSNDPKDQPTWAVLWSCEYSSPHFELCTKPA